MPKHTSILAILGLSTLTLSAVPDRADGALACEQVATCSATSRGGGHLMEMARVVVDDNGCLESWVCVHEDGYLVRHYTLQ